MNVEHIYHDKEAVGSDDDSEWLDDPVALGLQEGASKPAPHPLAGIERPDHISPETHSLVLKTMVGSEGWQQRKEADDEFVALRYKRMAELRLRAAGGGADGAAAALVASELEDLDGERLTRALSTQDTNDALVVHVHAPSARGSAVIDAAVATLAARHSAAKRMREGGSAGDSASAFGGGDVRELPGRGALAFARLAAVDGGVTARLDVIDEDALPALLIYRGGRLAASRLSVALPSMVARAQAAEERPGRDPGRRGEGGGGKGGGAVDRVSAEDDLGQLADEVEDLLDDLGLYD